MAAQASGQAITSTIGNASVVVQFGSTTYTPRLNLFYTSPRIWHGFGFITGVLVFAFAGIAILLMSLGEEEAAGVLRHLSPKEVQGLGQAIAKRFAFIINAITKFFAGLWITIIGTHIHTFVLGIARSNIIHI